MAQVLSHRPFAMEDRVRSRNSSCEICGGQNDIGTGFSPCTLVVSSQYHSSNVPQSFPSTEGQMGEASKSRRKQCPFGNRRALAIKVFPFSLRFEDYIKSVTHIHVDLFEKARERLEKTWVVR
jgi:hypothetical protein